MERKRVWDQETALIKELSQGRDLTELLKIKLENPDTPELCETIILNIISIYDKAISMLNFRNSVGVTNPKAIDQSIQDVNKKRKTMARWTKEVRVRPETGQCELSDGSSWRKYGQKVILGAKFPRSYYRCTHRHVQGCLATKQVQRSDEDPSLFLISYSGKHSCVSSSSATQLNDHAWDFETKFPKQYKNQLPNQNQLKDLMNIGTEETTPCSFSFPCSETFIFPESSFQGNSFLDNFECEIGDFGLADVTASQCHEILSAQTSTTNSPIGKSDFSFDQVEFFSDLPFDTSELFSS